MQPNALRRSALMLRKGAFFNKNQAKQNHAFASVTYKIRCADFSVRTERGEFSRLSLLRLKLTRRAAQNMCSAHIFKIIFM